MNIGDTAAYCGLSEHTLRYYEKVGLLPTIQRDGAKQRSYSPENLRWLDFLVKLRSTRMPLKDMVRYAELARQGDATLAARRQLLEEHERRVQATLAQMQDSLDAIHHKLELYRVWEKVGRSDPSDYAATRRKKGL